MSRCYVLLRRAKGKARLAQGMRVIPWRYRRAGWPDPGRLLWPAGGRDAPAARGLDGGQRHIEHHVGEGAVQVALGDLGGVFNPLGGHDELFAGGKGEVVIGVGVACQVDLGGQVLVARGGDKVVDMRRALAVTTEGLEHHVGGAPAGTP
ncbi:hypothetical protein KO116_00238 [Halomonas sp. KO116]|nr:hypothetical protein KO116_00238 [Halomonas sp. KO116]